MEIDSEAALRRVAIVLSSLPEATVARLVAGLGGDQQRIVRAAISRLSDVDALERRRVLDAFAASVRRGQTPVASENDAAEIVLSSAAMQHHDSHPPYGNASPAAASAPLAFLSGVKDDALTIEVRQEHPQTIAIILASLAPAQAARILSQLDVATRQETMRRLAKLDTPSPEVIRDIGGQLKNKLLAGGARFGAATTASDRNGGRSKVGQAALRAILAEMPATAAHPSWGAAPGPASPADFDSAIASGLLSDPSNDPRSVPGREHASAAPARTASSAPRCAEPTQSAVDPTEAIHARLVALPTERLRQALASVQTRQSLLALCGLPSATAEKVLASLPRRQARQVRRQLAELGTIELREIDQAKEAVAIVAEKFDRDPHGEPASPADAAVRQRSLMAA